MIRLYDTAARQKRLFEPADPKRITMYVCGPTVYGRAHIGNARPAVVFDVLRRLLKHSYPEHRVTYARNITDVDDKIIDAARAEGVDTSVITQRYEQAYLEDMRALGVQDPDIAPHATEEIGPMIAMIAGLIERGHAYAAEGHVLFDVSSDPDYGTLSRRDREAMLAGARVEIAPYKRSPGDFVLWKPSSPEVIGWESPWGRGRPGWHIECSAMIRAHLGETIDIHGGGIDLVFPHHENEAAQSRCAHGEPLARFWMHNGFVDFGAEKMSKSLGNVVTPREMLDAGVWGDIQRIALLSAHYRSPLPWTSDLLRRSEDFAGKMMAALSQLRSVPVHIEGHAPDEFLEVLANDLATPQALDYLWGLSRSALGALTSGHSDYEQLALQVLACLTMLGIPTSSYLPKDEDTSAIDSRIAERTAAKQARDFATADRIRDELKAEGILLEDGPQGTTWRRA